jgi:hypothetical protein
LAKPSFAGIAARRWPTCNGVTPDIESDKGSNATGQLGPIDVTTSAIMCNGSWVCFDCRPAVRRRTWRAITHVRPDLIGSTDLEDVRCPTCHQPCRFLGPTMELPRKRDAAAWPRLRKHVDRTRIAAVEDEQVRSARHRHTLEKRIRSLKSRPASPSRDATTRDLRAELAAISPQR